MSEVAHEPLPARRQVRWGTVSATVLFIYALFLAVEVAAAGFDHRLYNRLHQVQGNAVSRFVLAAVVLCALFHGCDGLRIALGALVPAVKKRDAALVSLVQFTTFAVGLPAAFVIVWPSVVELFR